MYINWYNESTAGADASVEALKLYHMLSLHIGANRPGTPGAVPDLEALSLVPPGKCYLPEMSRIFKVAAPELG